jgi:LacI family transcriptional regulator
MSTIHEVAKRAGVSPTTVSHVINNTRFVSKEVKERVNEAMAELQFQPNALARSLRRGKTHTLGLILPDSANPFFAEIGHGIEATAFNLDYSVILCNTEGNVDKERLYLNVLSNKRVDGIILVSVGEQEDLLRVLQTYRRPLVLVDRILPDVQTDAVLCDNFQGGYIATRHLIDLGHRRIGVVAGPYYLTPSSHRVTGYSEALAEAGIPTDESLMVRGDFQSESGWKAARELFKIPDPPTAIFACNDMMAIGVLRAAAETGKKVPDDLAVVGFDDITLAAYTVPSLTSVAQPKSKMSELAVQILIQRIELKEDEELPLRNEVLCPSLVVRGSCGGCA